MGMLTLIVGYDEATCVNHQDDQGNPEDNAAVAMDGHMPDVFRAGWLESDWSHLHICRPRSQTLPICGNKTWMETIWSESMWLFVVCGPAARNVCRWADWRELVTGGGITTCSWRTVCFLWSSMLCSLKPHTYHIFWLGACVRFRRTDQPHYS